MKDPATGSETDDVDSSASNEDDPAYDENGGGLECYVVDIQTFRNEVLPASNYLRRLFSTSVVRPEKLGLRLRVVIILSLPVLPIVAMVVVSITEVAAHFIHHHAHDVGLNAIQRA